MGGGGGGRARGEGAVGEVKSCMSIVVTRSLGSFPNRESCLMLHPY